MQDFLYFICIIAINLVMIIYRARKTSTFKIVTVERYIDPPIFVLYRKYKIIFGLIPLWKKVESKIIFRKYKEAEDTAYAINEADILRGLTDSGIPEIISEVRKLDV